MKVNKALTVAGLLLVLVTPALTEETSATYAQIESEIGCQGKATDMKKDLIFNTKYRGRWVTWTGIVHDVKDGAIWFKAIGSHSIGSDFDVKMAPSVDLMQFDKDQTVTVRFQIKDYMGCILPLRGTDGTIVNNRG
jgi:hypothetical protein